MPRKRTKPQGSADAEPIVTFEFEHRTYQIDPDRRKVYRGFVEIETAKAATIFSVWRTLRASA
jgi:hypothetical protein